MSRPSALVKRYTLGTLSPSWLTELVPGVLILPELVLVTEANASEEALRAMMLYNV